MFGISGILCSNSCGFVVPFMDDDAIAERDGLAWCEGVTAVLLWVVQKVRKTKRICGYQTISSSVPVGRVMKAWGLSKTATPTEWPSIVPSTLTQWYAYPKPLSRRRLRLS